MRDSVGCSDATVFTITSFLTGESIAALKAKLLPVTQVVLLDTPILGLGQAYLRTASLLPADITKTTAVLARAALPIGLDTCFWVGFGNASAWVVGFSVSLAHEVGTAIIVRETSSFQFLTFLGRRAVCHSQIDFETTAQAIFTVTRDVNGLGAETAMIHRRQSRQLFVGQNRMRNE